MPPSDRPQSLALVCGVGCSLGALALVAGLLWLALGSGRAVYTPEQAKEFAAASAALHNATTGHVHEAPAPGPAPPPLSRAEREAAVATARQRFERAEADLKTARFAENHLGTWLISLGLAATVAFGIGYIAARAPGD